MGWERDDLARALAGISPDVSDDAINDVIHDQHAIIQRYVASLGFGVVRKRMGGAGAAGGGDVYGYEAGFGAAALCGHIPIPSSGIDGNGARYATGTSGAMEVFYTSPQDILRPKITIADFLQPEKNNDPKVKKRNMARCHSRKCLDCTVKEADQDAAELQWVLALRLFRGESYCHITFTLRHFHRDDRRQILAIRDIFADFAKSYAVKKVARDYGLQIIFRAQEITKDAITRRRQKTGSHPHYHATGIFHRKIDWGKKSGITVYAVPTVADCQKIEEILAAGWYDCIETYYDKEKEGWAAKHKADILARGLKVQLYLHEGLNSVAETPEELQAIEDIYAKCVEQVREEWETNTYEMPEQCKKFKPYIDELWKNDKEHFFLQLAGLSNIASYAGGVSKFDVYKEVTQGAKKHGKGKESRRVNYFTWLYQAALAHDPKIDNEARELIRALYRLRFRFKSKIYKQTLHEPFTIWDAEMRQIKDVGLTRKELQENDSFLLPRYLPGDEIRLAAYPFGGPDYTVAHKYGSDQAIARTNKEILRLVKEKKPVTVDKVRAFWADTEKDMRSRVMRDCYNPMSESVLPDYYCADGAPAAGRAAPIIPDYMLESSCWDYDAERLKSQSRKYQNILRFCKQYAPKEYWFMVSSLLSDAEIGEICSNEADLVDFDHYSARAEKLVLQMWADGGVKARIQDADPYRRHNCAARVDAEREQAHEEYTAIKGVLLINGDYTSADISRYMQDASYEKIWDDVYGTFAVCRVSYGYGLDRKALSVAGAASISRAALEIGLGWCVGPDAPPVSGLQSMCGWWGVGYVPEAFDLDLAGRQAAILGAEFDFLPRREYINGVEIWARGRGKYADCVLTYSPGKLSALLSQRRAERDARLRDAADAALRDVQDTARRVGWQAKAVRENRVFLRILAQAATVGVSLDLVESALVNARFNAKCRKSRMRLISRLEREILWRDLTPDQVCADCATAVDWVLPRWSAAVYERTGQYVEAAPPVPQEILPGLAV